MGHVKEIFHRPICRAASDIKGKRDCSKKHALAEAGTPPKFVWIEK
jgi:hypothetical protein